MGKAHGIAQKSHLVQVQGIPDPGNDMLRTEFPGCDAADHIHLVLFRRGHHKVGRSDAGAPERLRIGGVSLDTDDIKVV